MSDRLSEVLSELETVSQDVRSTFGSLAPEQLNWKPASDSWSVAQCLDHLIRSADEFYPELAKVASGTRKNSFWQNYSPFTGIGGRFLINTLKTDSRKAKAPSKAIVPPSEVDAGVVERFVAKNEDLISKIKATAVADWKKTVVSSPFLAVMTYTVDDAYTVLIEHEKRHVRQAKRVTEMEGFPG
jgi:hypothetical protein